MLFVDRLREYLRRAASSPVRELGPPDRDIDIALCRKHLRQSLERLEQQLEPAQLEKLHAEWTAGDRLASFVHSFVVDHIDRVGRDATSQPLQKLVTAAIDAQLGLPLKGSLTWRLEIQNAAKRAWSISSISDNRFWWAPEPYALEIRAIQVDQGHRVTPTAVGRVALELAGTDLVRWLLQVEAELSLGPRDRWRLSRAIAASLVAKRRHTVHQWDPSAPSIETLDRLQGMGVIDKLSEGENLKWTYTVRDAAVPILEEIAGTTETPLRVLAATLLGDDRNAALTRAQPALASLFGEEAAAAGIRQARMVAHEVRNSLVPVQVALEGLYRVLEPTALEGIDRYRGRIDDGVNRVFKFVDETLRVLTLAAEPPEAFDVSSVLLDALGSISPAEAEITRAIPAPGELPPVVGARSRFVLAIVNVLRNAIQSTPDRRPNVAITTTIASDAGSLVITIDDDGPGVPDTHRESIFARGFSLRPGGTGMGLALTREVVEKELRGRITCASSPLGGARFEITLPIIGKGAS
ncbi:MAG TPA: HAMP domain-containing sensor histidine kinase [Kofleriaceae bacterium]|nr:HAMP domain-containing sensor histidine kinase [Kofleriaceae bacterium]